MPSKRESDESPRVNPNDEEQFPIVGIGASAGGLPASEAFFQALPATPGMAFVVVQHIAPDYQSEMAKILQTQTSLEVAEAVDGMLIEPDRVYTIPPGHSLAVQGKRLRVRESPRQNRHVDNPIDGFFRSLASEVGEKTTCIVLSGTGSDGTLGLKAVKEAGGLVLVQDPDEAEYDGMPRSAIGTGLVDIVAPVRDLAAQLIDFRDNAQLVSLPDVPEDLLDDDSEALSRILAQIRSRTGHDFSHYKRNTLLRRLGRRLQLLHLKDLTGYLDFVRTHPDELDALFRDLLISVTNFFRDPDAWDSLRELVPDLFEGKRQQDSIRVWVPGCATGEEAYSIAMMLCEHASTLDRRPQIQIFATDIDEDALAFAREGVYPESVASDLSPSLMKHYFERQGASFRVRKSIRDMVLFASHNLLQDAPFSRQDLISCRNLLIYLSREVQETILETFHYALKADGYLFLGSSESAEASERVFKPINKRHRLYQRRANPPRIPTFPTIAAADPGREGREHRAGRGGDRTVAERHRAHLMSNRVPPTVLVNSEYDIYHMAGGAHRFLRETDGVPTSDILRKIVPELRLDVRTGLFQAFQTARPIEMRVSSFEFEGAKHDLRIEVVPLDEREFHGRFAEVTFYLEDEDPRIAARPAVPEDDEIASHLEDELDRTRERLQTIIEEYETANEELQASNEELQSMNEELRSTSEELETGREELQSMNEELVTVNHELRVKIDELGRANADLSNLMASTDIGTIFVDRNLRIKRYTPRAEQFFHLQANDIGRPLRAITQKIRGEDLVKLCQSVLNDLIPVEDEQRTDSGRWIITRIRPYRTADDAIEGAVLTFIDVTDLKEAERTASFQANVLEQVHDAVIAVDLDEEIIYFNTAAETLYALDPKKTLGRKMSQLIRVEYADTESKDAAVAAVSGVGEWKGEVVHHTHDDRKLHVEARISGLVDSKGERIGTLGVLRDISKRVEAEDLAREREHYLVATLRNVPLSASIQGTDLRYRWVHDPAERFEEDEILGRTDEDVFQAEDARALTEIKTEVLRNRQSVRREVVIHYPDGPRYYDLTSDPVIDDRGELVGVSSAALDITDRKNREEELRRAKREAERANAAKANFLAAMSHELRTPLNAVMGYVDLMEMGVPDVLTEGQIRQVGRIRMSARHLLQVIEEVLQFARLDAGRETAEVSSLTISDLLEEIDAVALPLVEAKGLQLRIEKGTPPDRVFTDPRKVRQVLLNLVGNAVKFTSEGRVELRVEADVDGGVIFHVIDTGLGMNEEDMTQIFRPFWQADGSLSRTTGGSGLGLTISKRYLDLIGGSIEVRSVLGEGTAFTVRVPSLPEPPVF